MRTSVIDGIRYTYPDANIWTQERLLIYCSRQSGTRTQVSLQTSPYTGVIATYTLANNGTAIIDITDYVRTYVSSSITIYVATEGGYQQIDLSVQGYLNPARVLIPHHPLEDAGVLIAPPSMILHDSVNADGTQLEFYATSGSWSVEDTDTAKMGVTQRGIYDIADNFNVIDGDDNKHEFSITPLQECDQYAKVRWVSFTGAFRQSIFEVRKAVVSAAEVVSLVELSNGYNEAKGRVDGCTLHLEGLNAYDVWYYSDVIFSSKVEVCFDGTNWLRVQVTDKSVTIPDGEAGVNGKLDIKINFAHYDTLAL